MEEIMREELTQFLGAQWGECSPERKGYRNGSYTRDLATVSGQIQDLKVPRDREGKFHTQLFDRYKRETGMRWGSGLPVNSDTMASPKRKRKPSSLTLPIVSPRSAVRIPHKKP